MTVRAIFLYVVAALAVSWGIQSFAITTYGLDAPVTKSLFILVMWSPTFIALCVITANRGAREGVLWRLGRPAFLPLGIGVEAAIGIAMVAILCFLGLATSGWFGFSAGGVLVRGGPWVLGHGLQGWPLFAGNVLATASVYSLFGLIASTGEEFAWRGFLQGQLIRRLGVRTGILAVAAVWWAWHLPGLLAGYNFPHYPALGAFVLFPLQMIGASFFFGWLTIRSGSFWPAALAHAAVNSIQQGLVDDLHLTGSHLAADLLRTGLVLLVGGVSWIALERSAHGDPDPDTRPPVQGGLRGSAAIARGD